MKKQIVTLLAALVCFGPSFAESNSYFLMKELAQQSNGPFEEYETFSGFTVEKIDAFAWPKAMIEQVDKINQQRIDEWADYVMNSGEFDHVDFKEDLITDPSNEWGSPTPLRLNDSFAIYKNGKLIGYVADFSDMVDSAIIQDGSGWVFFVDVDGNLIDVKDWQS